MLKLSFPRGGAYYYSNGFLGNGGGNGYYWESRVYSSTDGMILLFDSTHLNPQYTDTKGYGFSLRCIVRIPPSHK